MDANMPYYNAHTICSFFGLKHAQFLCPCNLQLFWTQTCPTTMPIQFAAFLDANMHYYYAHAICSFFGRKYALILWPCNLQLFWTHRYAENTKILEKWGGNLPKMTHISLQLQWKICTKWGNKPPKYDANSQDFGHKNLSFAMGVRGLTAPPRDENWPLVFPELLGRLNADPISKLILVSILIGNQPNVF